MSIDNPKNQSDTYLVFQMAKVASRSWVKLLSNASPNASVTHFHSISKHSITKVEQITASNATNQTIKHLTLPRLGRPPEHIQQYIKRNVWQGPPVKIIAGVREPIARAVSAIGFLSNRLGYSPYGVTVRDGGNAQNLTKLFFQALNIAKSGESTDDTLITLLAHVINDYDRWFKEELAAGFGLDIYQASFSNTSKTLRLKGAHELLVYRVEDLKNPNACKLLLEDASQFLGTKVTSFPEDDVSQESRYRALYKNFAKSLKLSSEDIQWFYDNETVKHFYSPEEITSFKKQWQHI
jgi:hypothetical protein